MNDIFDLLMEEKKPEQIKEEKKKDITIFDYINQINLKTNKLKFDPKKCSAYMLLLHYSHDNYLLEITNNLNPFLYSLNPELVYKYFLDKIPKGKRFTKWVKKDKIKDNTIELLMKKYDISYREAQESLMGL